MTKEQQYTAALKELGIYQPAFDGEIHTLCILEREHSRTLKAWKATAPDKETPPSVEDALYPVIVQQRRDILAHRDALGLTPKALRRLLRSSATDDPAAVGMRAASPVVAELLSNLKQQAEANARVSNLDTESAHA